jgi:hypothetical protein
MCSGSELLSSSGSHYRPFVFAGIVSRYASLVFPDFLAIFGDRRTGFGDRWIEYTSGDARVRAIRLATLLGAKIHS